MRTRKIPLLLGSQLLGLSLLGCGSQNSSPSNNPVPSITAVSPSAVTAAGTAFTLTVSGTNFISRSVVRWNGSDRPTTFVSRTQLTAAIPASDVASAGTANVTVASPAPGGGISSALTFAINAPPGNPVPVVLSLSDSSAPERWPGFALTVTGSGFVAATVAQWNGLNHQTTILSNTQLRVAIPAADLATAGTARVTVVNPSPGGGTSGVLNFTISPVASNAAGVIDRASVAVDFSSANADSRAPAISSDGRYVAFESDASNLVSGDTNSETDVFLRDTCLGAPAGCMPSVIRVSVDGSGAEGNAESSAPSLSADGRYVSFNSEATNLVSVNNAATGEVYVHDTCIGAPTGCIVSTIRVSSNSGTEDSFAPSFSVDGRYVAYSVSPRSGGPLSTRIADTCLGVPTGCTHSVISLPDSTFGARLSGNGRYVVFESDRTDLVPNDTNQTDDIFLQDTCLGAAAGCTPSTIRVSVDSSGNEGNGFSFLPAVSTDGRFVVFTSWATNLVPGDTNGGHDVVLHDTCIGAAAGCMPATIRVSVGNNGNEADAASGGPATAGASISADGRFVAFGSRATNLVTSDTNGTFDIFIRDTCLGVPAGCTPSTVRLSVALDGTEGDGRSDVPRITADGRFIVFQSQATRLALGDGSPMLDVFMARTGQP